MPARVVLLSVRQQLVGHKHGRGEALSLETMPSDRPDSAFETLQQAASRCQSNKPRALLNSSSLRAREAFTNLVT
jgi:hypothetical protein